MRLTFALVAAVMLMRVMNGDWAPTLDDDSMDRDEMFSSNEAPGVGDLAPTYDDDLMDRDEMFSSKDAPGVSSTDGTVSEDNRESDAVPDGIHGVGSFEADPKTEKRSPAIWKSPWIEVYPPNRRAFSPWGGKRYFNPWGGKRIKAIFLERKAESVYDKRPGFQPWGGKRESQSRGQMNAVKRNVRPRLNRNRRLFGVKP